MTSGSGFLLNFGQGKDRAGLGAQGDQGGTCCLGSNVPVRACGFQTLPLSPDLACGEEEGADGGSRTALAPAYGKSLVGEGGKRTGAELRVEALRSSISPTPDYSHEQAEGLERGFL